jgi:hypothetical protein
MAKQEVKTETRGGAREGAGRKKTEDTTIYSFRLNTEAMEILRLKYERELTSKINKYIKKLAGI